VKIRRKGESEIPGIHLEPGIECFALKKRLKESLLRTLRKMGIFLGGGVRAYGLLGRGKTRLNILWKKETAKKKKKKRRRKPEEGRCRGEIKEKEIVTTMIWGIDQRKKLANMEFEKKEAQRFMLKEVTL